jgi:general secretion pathway protein A
MYLSHWGLESAPFEAKVDPRSYYPSECHQAAALKLHYAIEQRRSVALLCGDSGLGKTMVLESCLQQLTDEFSPIARVVYPAMHPDSLVKHIVRQIGPRESDDQLDMANLIENLERILRHNIGDGLHAVIAIDEAHLLQQYGALESLRLILNLASDASSSESALTLVLCGATTLVSHVAKNTSLEDRIAVRCVLERFTLDDTIAYISHRLRSAGCSNEEVFMARAVETIQLLSQGVPRRINRLCDLALMIGFAQDRTKIDSKTIEAAHAELSSFRQVA